MIPLFQSISRRFLRILSLHQLQTPQKHFSSTINISTHEKLNNSFCSQDIVSLLHHLAENGQEKHAKSLQSLAVKSGFIRDVYIQNNMIKFYANSGDLVNARKLFDEIPEPNLVSWTSMVSAYVHDGQFDTGLCVFRLMCTSGVRPNEFGFSVALKACRVLRDFVMGMMIHGQVVKCGFEFDRYCSAAMLGMHVECGDNECAHRFFEGVPVWGRSEAMWNILLDGYVESCDEKRAVELFRQMVYSGVSPTCFTFSILCKLCGNLLNDDLQRLLHGQIIKVGFENDVVIGGALVDAYAKMGFLDDLYKVFEKIKEKDNVVWCSLLSAIHQVGDAEQGLNYYLKFLSEGNRPDPFMYASAFSLCSASDTESFGRQVHCSFIKDGFVMDPFIGSALVDMYGEMEMVSDAYNCFLEVMKKNEICYSSMIKNLVLNSDHEAAMRLFPEMKNLGLAPCHSTISYVLQACANCQFLRKGKSLHSLVVKSLGEYDPDLHVQNALIEMYAKCRAIEDAYLVFNKMETRNESSWTTIISGFSSLGQFEEALGLFSEFFLLSCEKPGPYAVVAVLQACTELNALDKGKQVHCCIIKLGYEFHSFVESALINMYAASTSKVQDSFRLFLSGKKQDLVTWSTMIIAWAKRGYFKEALNLFVTFQHAPIFSLDDSILSSSLSACAGLAMLETGKCFHAYCVRNGFMSHLHVASSIVDMYSKCGMTTDAYRAFDELEHQNSISWTAMICGYAYNGLGNDAINLFIRMKEAGFKPDGVTFLGILTACSHVGLVKEGWQHFESMITDYNLKVTLNHYACMVDLLGRAEQMDDAEDLINKAPFPLKSKALLWRVLLGACSKYENVEIGNRIAQILVELEVNEPSAYILSSNIYSSAMMWDNSTNMRNRMKVKNVNKQPGYSWIQVES